jgi:hypothetical protein
MLFLLVMEILSALIRKADEWSPEQEFYTLPHFMQMI